MSDPILDDDDSGPLSEWLKYKVWKTPGWVYVTLVFVAGLLIGHR